MIRFQPRSFVSFCFVLLLASGYSSPLEDCVSVLENVWCYKDDAKTVALGACLTNPISSGDEAALQPCLHLEGDLQLASLTTLSLANLKTVSGTVSIKDMSPANLFSQLTSVGSLIVEDATSTLWSAIQTIHTVDSSLVLRRVSGLASLGSAFGAVTSLQRLEITDCPALTSFTIPGLRFVNESLIFQGDNGLLDVSDWALESVGDLVVHGLTNAHFPSLKSAYSLSTVDTGDPALPAIVETISCPQLREITTQLELRATTLATVNLPQFRGFTYPHVLITDTPSLTSVQMPLLNGTGHFSITGQNDLLTHVDLNMVEVRGTLRINGIRQAVFPHLQTIGNGLFIMDYDGYGLLERLSAPSLQRIETNTFYLHQSVITEVDLPALAHCSTVSLQNLCCLREFILPSLETLGPYSTLEASYNTVLQVYSLPKLNDTTGNCENIQMQQNPELHTVYLRYLAYMTSQLYLYNNPSLSNWSIGAARIQSINIYGMPCPSTGRELPELISMLSPGMRPKFYDPVGPCYFYFPKYVGGGLSVSSLVATHDMEHVIDFPSTRSDFIYFNVQTCPGRWTLRINGTVENLSTNNYVSFSGTAGLTVEVANTAAIGYWALYTAADVNFTVYYVREAPFHSNLEIASQGQPGSYCHLYLPTIKSMKRLYIALHSVVSVYAPDLEILTDSIYISDVNCPQLYFPRLHTYMSEYFHVFDTLATAGCTYRLDFPALTNPTERPLTINIYNNPGLVGVSFPLLNFAKELNLRDNPDLPSYLPGFVSLTQLDKLDLRRNGRVDDYEGFAGFASLMTLGAVQTGYIDNEGLCVDTISDFAARLGYPAYVPATYEPSACPVQVHSVQPASIPATGARITITGRRFETTAGSVSMTLAGVPRTCSIVTWTSKEIVCDWPAGSGAVIAFLVTTASTQTPESVHSPVVAKVSYDPIINPVDGNNEGSGLVPFSGCRQGGTALLISGVNFGSTAGQVLVNNSACDVVTWSMEGISCTLPPFAWSDALVPVQVMRAGEAPIPDTGSNTVHYYIVPEIHGGWSTWSAYNASCGPAQHTRTCTSPAPSGCGADCVGASLEVTTLPCHGNWSTWSSPSATCGSAVRTRTCTNPPPTYGGNGCVGEASEAVTLDPCPVDGEWSAWSSPTLSCGSAIRTRSCTNPPPNYGGNDCVGATSEDVTLDPCPVDGGWSAWSSPAATCGPAVRTRTCTNPGPNHGGNNCAGNATDSVTLDPCPIDGGWSAWSSTNATCGSAIQTRSCTNPSPSYGGADCVGASSKDVTLDPCAIDGGWSEWSAYNATCGPAFRTRLCANPAPSHGGHECIGEATAVALLDACVSIVITPPDVPLSLPPAPPSSVRIVLTLATSTPTEETLNELLDRVAAFLQLPRDQIVIAAAHGGDVYFDVVADADQTLAIEALLGNPSAVGVVSTRVVRDTENDALTWENLRALRHPLPGIVCLVLLLSWIMLSGFAMCRPTKARKPYDIEPYTAFSEAPGSPLLSRLSVNLRRNHSLLSPFLGDSRSTFTPVARVTLYFAALLLAMAIAAVVFLTNTQEQPIGTAFALSLVMACIYALFALAITRQSSERECTRFVAVLIFAVLSILASILVILFASVKFHELPGSIDLHNSHDETRVSHDWLLCCGLVLLLEALVMEPAFCLLMAVAWPVYVAKRGSRVREFTPSTEEGERSSEAQQTTIIVTTNQRQ